VTYAEAQKEFQIRLYRWAKTAQEEELEGDFPNFRYFDEEFQRRFLFMGTLDRPSQFSLCRAWLKNRHQEAATALGDTVSLDEQTLMRKEEAFRLRQAPGTWEGRFTPKNESEQPPKANRKQLKKAIRDIFNAAFGSLFLPPNPLDKSGDMTFRIKCCGWIINTSFDFGRWEPEISHHQSIWTGKWITKEEPAVLLANALRIQMNYGNELGLGSTRRAILAENIEPTCAEIIAHCRIMFDAFPKLLEGLELESLTK
jgi:hypothetical protein